jgi:hypothetical protein
VAEQEPSVTAAVVASTLLLLRDDPELGPLTAPEATASIEAMVRGTLPIFGHVLDHASSRRRRAAATAIATGAKLPTSSRTGGGIGRRSGFRFRRGNT